MDRANLDRLKSRGFTFSDRHEELADNLEALRKKEGENAKISKIEYKPIDSKVEKYKYFEVKITLNTEYYTNLVELELDGRIFQATRKSNTFEQQAFYATVFVDLSQSNRKEEIYILTVTLKDLIGVISNLKSVGMKVENLNIKSTDNERKDIKDLKPSLNLYALLKEIELLKKVIYNNENEIIKVIPYPSPEGGAATIGYGHKIKTGENYNNGICLEEVEILLVNDVQTEGVDKLMSFSDEKKIKVKLNQNEYDAVISAVFNNGYGETLANAINKGHEYYSANPETIYKAFLKRVYANNPKTGKKEILSGLIKRNARHADIFIKNKWHSYGASDYKFKNDKESIDAFKKFLINNILPILAIFILFSTSCQKQKNIIDKNYLENSLEKNVKLELALQRIYKFDDGNGSNLEVIENYEKEKESWLKEINIAYKMVLIKVSSENSENLINFKRYHLDWEKYITSKRNFESDFIRNYYPTGEYIFYLMPYFRSEYESKLIEYYNLLSIN